MKKYPLAIALIAWLAFVVTACVTNGERKEHQQGSKHEVRK